MQYDQRIRDDGPQHEDRAVGEVDHVEDTEDERVSHGEERVNRPDKDRVEDLLGQRTFS